MTHSMKGLFLTLSINDIQHCNTAKILGVFMLSVASMYHYAECRYAECRYAECRYAECRYAECRYAECRYAECRINLSLC
jgi:hypothetical protein